MLYQYHVTVSFEKKIISLPIDAISLNQTELIINELR